MRSLPRFAAGLLACIATALCVAQTASPAQPSVRLRGTIQSVAASALTIKERSGEVINLVLSDKLVVSEVFPVAFADIRPGSYIGTGAVPQPDGSRRAVAVTVFPETARGVGEGDYPFDALPSGTMTNATVAEVVAAPAGRQLRLKFKGGEATIVVPEQAPVVSFRPADRNLLVPGASIAVSAQVIDGKPTALRISAGRDGFAVPY